MFASVFNMIRTFSAESSCHSKWYLSVLCVLVQV